MVAPPAPPPITSKPVSHSASLANLRPGQAQDHLDSLHTPPPAARRSLPCSRLVATLPAATTTSLPPPAQRSPARQPVPDSDRV
ncbi:hypothetical protein LZ32DRAFT_37307 [Colletotrichum eremochloae]|nr:hypothetical protein LZ32DRAFT_37307 [Colletotrichum eremochloae]